MTKKEIAHTDDFNLTMFSMVPAESVPAAQRIKDEVAEVDTIVRNMKQVAEASEATSRRHSGREAIEKIRDHLKAEGWTQVTYKPGDQAKIKLEQMIEKYHGKPIEAGAHLEVLELMLQKHTLNEWAIKCWSGNRKVEDYHKRLVEMLRTREWALEELARVEALVGPFHPIERQGSVSKALQVLLESPPEIIRGMQQVINLMNAYSVNAKETEKQRRLPFFARVHLFIKRLLGTAQPLEWGQSVLEAPLKEMVKENASRKALQPLLEKNGLAPREQALSKEERYKRLADGWVDASVLDPMPLEYDFSGSDVAQDLSNEELREFQKRMAK